MSRQNAAVILAAGLGKRMQSALPKVLHPCAELPLVCHVIRLAQACNCAPIVVVVSPATKEPVQEAVRQHVGDAAIRFAVQAEPRGTGDAARAGIGALDGFAGDVLLLYGDVPLLQAQTIERLRQARQQACVALLSAKVAQPSGYGRVVRRADGQVTAIVEEKDCNDAQRQLQEINAGVYVCEAGVLRTALAGLTPQNAQNEYYLTDIVAHAAGHGGAQAVVVHDVDEIRGVNNRLDLYEATRALQDRLLRQHALAGVAVQDVAGSFVGLDVVLEPDVTLGIGVQLYGKTVVRRGAVIEGPTVVRDSEIGPRCVVHAFCHLEQARMDEDASIGPYARLRPQAHLKSHARVGNFVELKKATLGEGAKANHLAYIGDAEVGAHSNIGAGTIFCNYDGFNKHRTQLGSRVFVGSNSTLVAPLQLRDGAFVAAGSTLTRDVPGDALALGRAQQVIKEGYANKLRDRFAAQQQANKKKVL
ncbi:MAG: UDP-N-acetylglucosamine diphosphorylase/glucosamine-1-phosphate N-acetyltransferase [Deltaproteobacteria bacterium]|nr:MAG: UDP-N-acetylglucosamine diphosphorylase/glucosamine-1-phosphate N-acetyltransferase [Deltaproteobacteria bacterium]